jgi:hypothetical protein
MARKEYLAALQNWPGHAGAKKRLTAGIVEEERDYIVHTIRPGESISRLALRYYGDFKKYPLIAKFNAMKNATRVGVGQKVNIPEIDGIPVAELEKRHAAYLASLKKTEPVKPETGTLAQAEQPAPFGGIPEPVDSLKPVVQEGSVEPETPVQDEAQADEPQGDETWADETQAGEALVDEAQANEVVLESPGPEPGTMEDEGVAGEVLQEPLAMVVPEDVEPPVLLEETFDDAGIYLAQGMELFDQKEYKDAILEFDLAKKADPVNPKVLDYLYQAHYQQGLIHHSREEFLEATNSFEAALENNPNCEKCSEYMEKSLETYKEKHYTMGIYHFGKEQLKEAIAEWQVVKAIDPGYKEVSPNLKKAEMLFQRLETIKQSDN